MNKVIIMSEQPKWLVKILNGDKTIDIRKTKPKCELPIDVYLYCTKGTLYFDSYENEWQTSKVDRRLLNPNLHHRSGKVIAKFTLKKVDEIFNILFGYGMYKKPQKYLDEVMEKSCMSNNQLEKYLNKKNGYAWHIDNLIIFDKPMELSEFYGVIHYPKGQFITPNICDYGEGYEEDKKQCLKSFKVNKAPQSWQYVYVEGKV